MFIINDYPDLVNKIKADGCHIGQSDVSLKNSKKFLKTNKIIGITCHGSKKLVSIALKDKPDYLAIGSFFKSKLKPNAKRAKRNLMPLQPGDVPDTSADISGLKDFSGYEPKTSIKIGVKNFIDWYKEYYKVNL